MIYLRFFGRQINPRPRQSLMMMMGGHKVAEEESFGTETSSGDWVDVRWWSNMFT